MSNHPGNGHRWAQRTAFACLFACSTVLGTEASTKLELSGLTDLDGNAVEPYQTVGIAHVFVFVRSDCPIGNRYAPELGRLFERFEPQGVRFWLVYLDNDQSKVLIQKHLDDYSLKGRPIRDSKHTLVDHTGVTVTPEVAVFDADAVLRYRGRIDDRFVSLGKARREARERDVANALEALLSGKEILTPTTSAVGCHIADLR